MAVYKRTYTGYEGELTPEWSRFLILPRFTYSRLSTGRFLTIFRILSLIYPLGLVAFVYLANNLSALSTLGILRGGPGAANAPLGNFLVVDSGTFLTYCWVQGAFAYLLTAFVGPTLVSPDLVNGALPLYLSRPFSRTEYVLGKMSVLVIMLSAITWIPGLIVFAVQCSLAGWEWTQNNFWIAGSLFIGLMIWVLVLSLIALALSAWVKWKIAAGALLLGVFVAGAGFGTAVNQILRTDYGTLLNLTTVMYTVWMNLFRHSPDTGISVEAAWGCLAVICAGCLWLLARKVRAFEVIK